MSLYYQDDHVVLYHDDCLGGVMTTHAVLFLDCCRQVLTFTSVEAQADYHANHVCEDDE